jgi:hypothetical protein
VNILTVLAFDHRVLARQQLVEEASQCAPRYLGDWLIAD